MTEIASPSQLETISPRSLDDDSSQTRYGPAFWVSVVIGWLGIGHGVLGLMQDSLHARLVDSTRRFVVLLVVNDLMFLPLFFLVGFLVVRFVPPVWRPPTRFALIVSGNVVLVAIFCVIAQIRDVQPGNDTDLPTNYYQSIAWLCTPTVAVALVWGLLRQRRARQLGHAPD